MSEVKIEDVIINQLLWNPKFFGRAAPFIELDYFETPVHKIIVDNIINYFNKYGAKIPDITVLKVLIDDYSNIDETSYSDVNNYIDTACEKRIEVDEEWLLESAEKFCLDRSVYNAIVKSINILDGKDKQLSQDSLPDLLQNALSVSFDTDVGHDYVEDAEKRYDSWHSMHNKFPCSLDSVNKITNGGFETKTLNIFIGSPGAGKSIMLAQLAKDYVEEGYNVLFISLEMSAENIATRVDSNSMNVDINKLKNISKDSFLSKISKIKGKTKGKLIVKQYEPGQAHVGHFESLVKELKIKKDFVPKIILVDYIGICGSKTVNKSVGLYSYGKAVTEELRAFMIRQDVVGFSVVQFNRSAAFSSDATHSGIADSSAIEHTVDFMGGLLITEQLQERKRIILLQMKNRYGPVDVFKRQLLGLDTPFMRYYDAPADEDIDSVKVDEGDEALYDKSIKQHQQRLPITKVGGNKNMKKINI